MIFTALLTAQVITPELLTFTTNTKITVKQAAVSRDLTCGVDPDSKIYCWKTSDKTATPELKNGNLKQIAIHGVRACGATNGGYIACTNDITEDYVEWKQITKPSKTLLQVDLNDDLICGTNTIGRVSCGSFLQAMGDSGDKNQLWLNKNGKGSTGLPIRLTQVSISDKSACGTGTDQKIYCTKDISESAPIWEKLQSETWFKHVEIKFDKMCGITLKNKISCNLLFNTESKWVSSEETYKSLTLDSTLVIGIDIYNHPHTAKYKKEEDKK